MVQTTSSEFLLYAQATCQRVDEALRRYCDLGPACPEQLSNAMRHSLLAPGKRLRPLLTLLAAEACGADADAAMPAACAVEMVHCYSLIHDDLPAMDDDDLRRGRPTCHVAFGEAMAILAGDTLLTLAFELIAGQVQPPEVAARCCHQLARAAGAGGMAGGQVDDLAAERGGGDVAQLESIHRRKTGAMLTASIRLGALIARAGDDDLAALNQFGGHLGLAFQITDDLLDSEGDERSVGKRIGKDAQRGKLTFPTLLGADESRQRARQLIDAACDALTPLGDRGASLEALARYVLERNR